MKLQGTWLLPTIEYVERKDDERRQLSSDRQQAGEKVI